MAALFWISVVLLVYVYLGYPALAWVLGRWLGRPVVADSILPRVTVLTAAHNEAAHIEATVRNKLAQDYPEDLLDVIVVSDESSDATDDIVRSLGPRVRLIRQAPRAGKTAALNLAVPAAAGEILVFADANSIYAPDAIRNLVANFADRTVGYVTGKLIYESSDGSLIGDGCTAYMRYENWLRAQESSLAGVIGVDGGIDAVRKELFKPMRADQLPDFVLPLSVAEQGYRVIYEPAALLREAALSKRGDEYRMRVRVALRAMNALWDMRHLFNPRRQPLLAFQLLSHKLLRYLAFIPLLLAFVTSVALSGRADIYMVAAVCLLMLLLLAVAGSLYGARRVPGVFGLPYYFMLLNLASAHALIRFLAGKRQATWAPRTG